jgi:16S rRNA processing protein RimM
LLTIGKIARPHGILGEVVLRLAPEYSGALQGVRRVYLGGDDRPYRVLARREHQGAVLLRLDRISTRNDAESMRGAGVSIRVSDLPELPEGTYYSHQLLGIRVLRDTGEFLGVVSEVLATGSNDVYVVKVGSGELLLPALDSVIREVNLQEGVMRVVVPAGLEQE